jgi:lysophospholipase L1-like esterase
MPRVLQNDNVLIHQTWPKILALKLAKMNMLIADFPMRARDTDTLKNPQLFIETIESCLPQIIILQIGIVDCAPRIISKQEHRLINRFFFPKMIRNIIIRNRKSKKLAILKKGSFKKCYTSPIKFKENYEVFIEKVKNRLPNTAIVLLPILGNHSYLNEISFGYSVNINKYNNLLSEISQKTSVIYLQGLSQMMDQKTFYGEDGYHLNEKGQDVIANEIFQVISNLNL